MALRHDEEGEGKLQYMITHIVARARRYERHLPFIG